MNEFKNPIRKRKKTSRQNAYIGKTGQLAVMSELALLGYNVSLPEVDKGEDVFVVDDHTRKLWRIQVKTATQQKDRRGNYQVVVLERQISKKPKDEVSDLFFVFVLRRTVKDEHDRDVSHWRFLVLRRNAEELHRQKGEGREDIRQPKSQDYAANLVDYIQQQKE